MSRGPKGSGLGVQGSALDQPAQRPWAAPHGIMAAIASATLWPAVVVLLFGASCRKVERPGTLPDQPDSISEEPEVVTTAGGFEMALIPAG